jgi:glycosyltransferase involved in cell wall biosynthesis
MRLVIATEERFDRSPDGSIWSSAQGHLGFWQRYLAVFDEVAVAARVMPIDHSLGSSVRADGEGVTFIPVPFYAGPRQYALRFFEVRRALQAAFAPDDAVILRVAGQIATTMAPTLYKRGHPFGAEVISDPAEMFAPGAVKHPMRPFFRWSYARAQRKQVAAAVAVIYVTEHTLQRRYPAAMDAYATYASNVELDNCAFIEEPRLLREACRLVTVGSLAHMYKGIDILLRALKICRDRGHIFQLTIIGEGRHRAELEALTRHLDIVDSVFFVGQLPSSTSVRLELDRADLFVLASRSEGLPRAMIEAMARGLPCIGTTVGGIPELLQDEALIRPGNVDELAAKLLELVAAPRLRMTLAQQNLLKSQEYRAEVLAERRVEFWRELRHRTEGKLARG